MDDIPKSRAEEGQNTVDLLAASLPSQTLLSGTAEYDKARSGFWAAEQARCTPYCIFQPSSAQDVARALHILRDTGCPFAIKSGGHGRCAGESSISAGVLIDLKKLDGVHLSEDRKTCRVGPGSTWASVYKELNPQGLTAVGGRASTVGVGGFCLSGGISFFSNRHGWALDNVKSFEVVLADGRILHASSSSYPDLYKALRGGCANFGIVTELELDVYPYDGMWGGSVNYTWEQGDALVDAFIEYGKVNVHNSDAAVILGLINYKGEWIWHADIEHLRAAPARENPVLKRFLDIPAVEDATGPISQIERTDSIVSHYPPGSYNGYWTFCTKADATIVKFFMQAWRDAVDPILHIEGLDRSALADVNFVSQNIINAMRQHGGNALNLVDKGPFLVFLMEPFWLKESDSPRVWEALRSTAAKTQEEAKRLNLHHEYIYLNYANPFQDVYGSYGDKARFFLSAVGAKYDPDGVFQIQRASGWHLHGPCSSASLSLEISGNPAAP
ncbi:hypothetical protein BDW60DRAFT_219047 [Aspergillus nidulans var. acristatus]